jgi:heme oxygenase
VELESSLGLVKTREEHISRLKRFYGFVKPLEERFVAVLGVDHSLLQGRLKTGLLRDDLRFFEEYGPDLPLCEALPKLESPREVVGALYVMEGSTLGGQMISRHVESTLHLSEGRGYSYFASYGPNVAKRWREFLAGISAYSVSTDDHLVIGAARDTFSSLSRWFSRSCTS